MRWVALVIPTWTEESTKTFKNVWQVELLRLPRCWFLWWHASSSCPSFFAFCSFTSVWRGAMLEEIPKPMFSFKADTWRGDYESLHLHLKGHSALAEGTCVERSSPKRRCSLFRSSISWTKRSSQQVCPGLCQEIGDSIFSRLSRLFQIVLA